MQKDTDSSTEVSDSEEAISYYSNELETISQLSKPSQEQIQEKLCFLGEKTKKVTLVLDLDETLAHSTEANITNYGAIQISTTIRPYAVTLLEKMSKKYEIVVFTAADEKYAKEVIKILDPKGIWIKKLVASEHCITLDNSIMVKDLRIFADRELNKMLIVDNSIFSFAFQLANGIPVSSFTGEGDDEELSYLIDYLDDLYKSEDIVQENAKNMRLTCGDTN